MAITFGFEFFISKPPVSLVFEGMFIPWCKDCDPRALLQAVGIVGRFSVRYRLQVTNSVPQGRS